MLFVMARIKWTVHLHLILCTQDAVNNSIQVTSTWDAVSLKKKKDGHEIEPGFEPRPSEFQSDVLTN